MSSRPLSSVSVGTRGIPGNYTTGWITCRSNDCRSNDCRSNDCRSIDCRINGTTPNAIVKILCPTAHIDCKMNGQNIRPVNPFTMVPSLSLTPNCQVQPVGISNQELESLLAKPAKELPVQVFYELGNKLQPLNHGVRTGDWIHLAELLGFSRQQIDNFEIRASIQREPPGFLMLMEWRSREDTSTLFILRDVLWTCGRHDCVNILDRNVEEIMFMNLYLRILDEANQALPMRLLKVRTKCDSTIRESIQNFLCGDSDDSEYELMDTPLLSKAKLFKGKQITLRKKNRSRPDILPNIMACDTSSSDNSVECNLSLPQTKDESKLPNQHVHPGTCCGVDTEPEVTAIPQRCADTTRKTIYISEDCVYCGRMRTVSRRRVVSETSFVKTGVHCPTCTCASPPSAVGNSRNSPSEVDSRFEHQWQNYENCVFDVSSRHRSCIDADQRNALNISTSRLSLEDTDQTLVKPLYPEVTSSESGSNTGNPTRRAISQNLPTDIRDAQFLPMTQVKRQRSASDPPETLLADLNNKFDLCISTSENVVNRPKRRKIELVFEEICETMRNFPGWDPNESEITVEQSMIPLCKEDGHYVIWYMKKMHRIVVSVSHMGTLYHYAVFSERHGDGQIWHYLFTPHKFTDIRSLLRHHMTNGLDSQETDLLKDKSALSRRDQTKLSHVVLKYPRRPQPLSR